MFQKAIKISQEYTLPVVISFRREKGETDSVIGSFILLNDEGWILTAQHIVEKIQELINEFNLYKSYKKESSAINSDISLSKAQRKKKMRSINKPSRNPITNFSPWWGVDGWRINQFKIDKLADLAIGKIDRFDKSLVKDYPTFKDPAKNFDVGENLCKLGFPFHNIEPTFDEANNAFRLPSDAFPIPLFPIEGIFTRTINFEDGLLSALYVETSSPGLRGQSGGPIFDSEGRIWAMQSRTLHHPLGFSPEVPNLKNKEHQFLNVGIGTHSKTIIDFLNNHNVQFNLSND